MQSINIIQLKQRVPKVKMLNLHQGGEIGEEDLEVVEEAMVEEM